MKIWPNFRTKSDFLPMSRQRDCFKVCYNCKKHWKEIETEWVHMISTKEGKNFFICSPCKNEIQ